MDSVNSAKSFRSQMSNQDYEQQIELHGNHNFVKNSGKIFGESGNVFEIKSGKVSR